MSFNIDIVIFIGFLIINLVIGLSCSRGIKDIREYALGGRNFSTATIAATIVATWLSGSSFGITTAETYTQGLYFIIPRIGDILAFYITACIYAPRMGEFLGNLSIAEAMGNLYGTQVRLISALSALIAAVGSIALQFAIISTLLTYWLGMPNIYALLISSSIIIAYSMAGGIKAVTFTDLIQFFTFGIIIPILAFIVWHSLESPQEAVSTLLQNPLFDYKLVFDYHNPEFLDRISLFIFFMIPALDSAFFQRVSMSRNTLQVSKAFIIAGLFVVICDLIFNTFIGVLIKASNPVNFDPNSIVEYILNNYLNPGFKGLFIVSIIAMVMSTADSYINSSAVLVAYDSLKALGINLSPKRELFTVRLASGIIGIIALLLSLGSKRLIDFVLFTYSFYMPIVTVPFTLAILGFRSTSKSVLIGMLTGFITVVLFKVFLDKDGLISGMVANLVALIVSHYLLNQPRGWVGIKEKVPLITIRMERKQKIINVISQIRNFNFLQFCQTTTPKQEVYFVYLGLFCIFSIFSNIYLISPTQYQYHKEIVNFIVYSVLAISSMFITYPVWAEKFKVRSIISVVWNISIIYCLVFSISILFIVSNFDPLLLSVVMANFTVLAILLSWKIALTAIVTGILTSSYFYKWYYSLDNFLIDMSMQFKIMYCLFLIISILIAFFKPKQEYQLLTEKKNNHLINRISFQGRELQKALALKGEFIRNISHEYHAPMVGISSMAEVLFESYNTLNDKQRLSAIETILKSSARLEVFDANISTLAKLSKPNCKLRLEPIDLSNLLYERVDTCRKLYEENHEDREFILNIADNITTNGDRYYLTQLLDNLLINAISYCKKGKIIIALKQDQDHIEFSISDEGIGIPPDELEDIFGEFTVSSKTHTQAGGRGVGLALCKRVIEVHGSTIKAESDGIKGSIISFVLPIA